MAFSRRQLLKGAAATSLLPLSVAFAAPATMLERPIPQGGEKLPVVGLGTYQVFAELNDPQTRQRLLEVLKLFHQMGGRVLDSSPMYGPAEATTGQLMADLPGVPRKEWFLATKVWTDGARAGARQMTTSAERFGVKQIDLMQIHNLRDWRAHLPTLRELKEQGRIRYLGATTWGGHDHDEMVRFMKSERPDFIQFTYSVVSREAEERLLPLAHDLGIATLINRPFEQGALFRRVRGKSLPPWVSRELGIESWAQLFLKFVVGDTRVTCVIPATSKPHHLKDNMQAGYGVMPDRSQRERLAALFG